MKSKSNRCVALFSLGLGLALFLLANSGSGQNSIQVGDGRSASEIGASTRSSDIRESDATSGNPEDRKTVYDKSGTAATPAPNPYGTSEQKDRITYGKRKERMETTASKSEGIKKTKYGSSDATEPTGAFKGTLLDSGLSLGVAPQPSAAPSASVNPIRSISSAPAAQSHVSPRPNAAPKKMAEPQLDITLGVNPAPSVAANPEASPAPSATVNPHSQ